MGSISPDTNKRPVSPTAPVSASKRICPSKYEYPFEEWVGEIFPHLSEAQRAPDEFQAVIANHGDRLFQIIKDSTTQAQKNRLIATLTLEVPTGRLVKLAAKNHSNINTHASHSDRSRESEQTVQSVEEKDVERNGTQLQQQNTNEENILTSLNDTEPQTTSEASERSGTNNTLDEESDADATITLEQMVIPYGLTISQLTDERFKPSDKQIKSAVNYLRDMKLDQAWKTEMVFSMIDDFAGIWLQTPPDRERKKFADNFLVGLFRFGSLLQRPLALAIPLLLHQRIEEIETECFLMTTAAREELVQLWIKSIAVRLHGSEGQHKSVDAWQSILLQKRAAGKHLYSLSMPPLNDSVIAYVHCSFDIQQVGGGDCSRMIISGLRAYLESKRKSLPHFDLFESAHVAVAALREGRLGEAGDFFKQIQQELRDPEHPLVGEYVKYRKKYGWGCEMITAAQIQSNVSRIPEGLQPSRKQRFSKRT